MQAQNANARRAVGTQIAIADATPPIAIFLKKSI
jgi:hypothetical protein